MRDQSIDITNLTCPMTFVRVKLQLEQMGPGESLKIRLNGGEPLENVPRSLKDQGFEVSGPWPDGEAFQLLARVPAGGE
ncbi:MAG: sulfurtransferase TusA family protein [Magnetococcales bacterium]|nr:sulfurtransferase TusA family protein [Magnetococcales bacterium]